MIGFTPNEIPYKTVKKTDTNNVNETSEEIDFALLWDTLLDDRNVGHDKDGGRHSRSL